ncbi:PLP-dependent transferase [Clostridium sp. 19966]|uniref:trans-sulfuration enzyme family protein n=1 Tax=Clostridium sp. 19966 TaxID=2768166 RepID=UPI0028DEA63F|nr:PLP-dependent aspartate aminotransferase family protein [Clostridium sp. 19966]MDT8719287.1 PLP-dependent transferase [Clostridium sp. 19966]
MEDCCRSFETKVVHGNGYKSKTGAVSIPIYQTATFQHPALGQSTGYDYSRLQNPTREEVEKTVALLEGGKEGMAFSTGMAGITCLFSLFKPGDHIILSDDLYGGTYRIMEELFKVYGVEADYVDASYIELVKKAVKPNTKAIYIETPTNPMMKISDISAIAALAKEIGAITIVDNTFMTPHFQKPFEYGADIVVHSGTKYLGGHNDTLAGFIVVKDNEELISRLRLLQKSIGSVLSPFDSWLILRGIKTLSIRMEKQQENALKIADFLSKHSKVKKIYYPGLESHLGYEIQKKQSTGFGAMISFEVNSEETVEKILEKVDLIMFAESLGGVETLITYPYRQTHADVPEDIKNSLGITKKLLRLSVGIEKAEDIIADLQAAME